MPCRIDVKEVSFSYDRGDPIVRDASLSLHPGEVVGLLGAVGGGKSTFLKLCAGLLQIIHGRLEIDHQHFWKLYELERNRLRRRMGFEFQEAALIANLTVRQNLELPLQYHGGLSRHAMAERIDQWFERLGLVPYQNLLPAAISLGLRRRVSLARCLLLGRDFFFFDEPTQGASHERAEFVAETIDQKREAGVGVLFATQDSGFLVRVADRVLILKEGRIAFDGPIREGRLPQEAMASGFLRE